MVLCQFKLKVVENKISLLDCWRYPWVWHNLEV